VVTLSTIGYGDVYPTTVEGRLIAMVLMFLGVGLFSAITATITSYLVGLGETTETEKGIGAELTQLAALRADGSLTDSEFALAKAKVIGSSTVS
jgi:voltage-gated potassium channel